jgi:hypothetical protein
MLNGNKSKQSSISLSILLAASLVFNDKKYPEATVKHEHK